MSFQNCGRFLNTRIVSSRFNLTGFDYEVLNHYYVGDAQKFPTLDILDVIKQTLGFRLKLDTVAKATLNEGKAVTDSWRLIIGERGVE